MTYECMGMLPLRPQADLQDMMTLARADAFGRKEGDVTRIKVRRSGPKRCGK